MPKEKIYQHLDADELQEALEEIKLKFTSRQKQARLLGGRLRNLEKQELSRTISNEQYLIERNRIREAILQLAEENETNLPISSNRINIVLAAIAALLIVVMGVSWYNKTPVATTPPPPTNSTGSDNMSNTLNNEVDATIVNLSDALQFQKFSVPAYEGSFNESKNYSQFAARLTRKYNWTTVVPVEPLEGKRFNLGINEVDSVLTISIPGIRMSHNISIQNKKATTTFNSLWISETEKDGSFWQSINDLAKAKINSYFQRNPKMGTDYGKVIRPVLEKELKQIVDKTGLKYKSLKINLNKLVLLNGRTVKLQ